jgi:hypothetical protein
VKAELRAGRPDDGDVHGRCYLFEGTIVATSASCLDALGETLDLGLPDRTMMTLLILFTILGLCFGACSSWRG